MNEENVILNDSRPSWMSIAIKYGVILGLISAIISLVTIISNSSGNYLIGIISFIISIIIVVMANKAYKSANGGYMSYGEGFKISLVSIVIGGIINGLVSFIYLQFIDPSALEAMKEAQIAATEKIMEALSVDIPEDQMDEAIAKIEADTTAFNFFKNAVISSIVGGLILALIIAAFTKKSRPEYE